MATQRNLRAVPEPAPVRDAPPDLRDDTRDALAAMNWLGPSDKALAALAQRYAEEIELAVVRSDLLGDLKRDAAGDDTLYKRLQKLEAMCDVNKTVGWLGPQLKDILRELGGSPASRKALQQEKPIGGRLAQLRAAANPGEDDT